MSMTVSFELKAIAFLTMGALATGCGEITSVDDGPPLTALADRDGPRKARGPQYFDSETRYKLSDSTWGLGASDCPNNVLDSWRFESSFARPPLAEFDVTILDSLYNSEDHVLDISEYRIGNKDVPAIKALTKLQWLRIRTVSARDLEWIATLPALRGLALHHAKLSRADFSIFGQMKELQWLDLSDSMYSEADFSRLPALPGLEALYLDGTVTDAMIKHLVTLRLPKLKKVSLRRSRISDAGVETLCDGYDLTYINLRFAGLITIDCVEALGREKSLLMLTVGQSGLSDPRQHRSDEVKKLLKLLPTCCVNNGT